MRKSRYQPDVNFGQIYRVTRANFNTRIVRHTQGYTSFFVQDTWRDRRASHDRPGAAYEQESLSAPSFMDFKLKNNWAPRIGASYLLTRKRNKALFGSYGIFLSPYNGSRSGNVHVSVVVLQPFVLLTARLLRKAWTSPRDAVEQQIAEMISSAWICALTERFADAEPLGRATEVADRVRQPRTLRGGGRLWT